MAVGGGDSPEVVSLLICVVDTLGAVLSDAAATEALAVPIEAPDEGDGGTGLAPPPPPLAAAGPGADDTPPPADGVAPGILPPPLGAAPPAAAGAAGVPGVC